MINYLTELAIIHLALVLGYWIFLRNERQHAKMRFYLIGSTFLALTIPLLKLPGLLFEGPSLTATAVDSMILDAVAVSATSKTTLLNYDLLLWAYLAVSIFFLFRFLRSVSYMIYLERKSTYERFHDLYIRKVPGVRGSLTFFTWIFLSDEIDNSREDYQVILKHEKAHVALGHTYDLIFFELFKVVFWWLPTTWYVINEIKKLHEYQADAYALESYSVDQYSSILISSTLKSNGWSLASSFHDGLIFKRLNAMKLQAKKVSPWKLGALGSLCAILFLVLACNEDGGHEANGTNDQNTLSSQDSHLEDEVFTVVEEQPQYPGGMDAFYRYMLNEITYPKEARVSGVEGSVYVSFVVEKDGSITGIKTLKGIGSGCNEEAERVVAGAGKFLPGKQRGRPVRVQLVLPVLFKLDAEKTNADDTQQGIIIVEEAESNGEALHVEAHYNKGEWSGTVYDPEGERLPGVNIIVGGTTTGTVSGTDGTFKLRANESSDLYFSFVGFKSVKLEGKKAL